MKKILILVPIFVFLFMDVVLATSFCGGAYEQGSGNWNVTSAVTCTNETIIVNGNITINGTNGNLTLENSTLKMDVVAGQDLVITVVGGSKGMSLRSSSTVESNTNYQYQFKVQGFFDAKNSIIADMGRQTAGPLEGLVLQTGAVTLTDVTIKDSERGIVVNADGIKTKNLAIDNIEDDAVHVVNGNNLLLEDCTITAATGKDIKVESGAANDIIHARSCSLSTAKVDVASTTSQVRLEWFTNVLVKDGATPLENAFVEVKDTNQVVAFSGYTDSNGHLYGNFVIEQIIKSGPDDFLNPHTFHGDKGALYCNKQVTVTSDRVGQSEVVLSLGSSGCGTGG